MARIDFQNYDDISASGAVFVDADILFDLGMRAACGHDGAVDFVAAHMYFNLADRKGSDVAAYHRQDVASQMSKAEVAAALRAARQWMTRH
ncbi:MULTISPECIES: sel1 repeat family protein [Aurantimonas]|uniref:sel1 repeat family protein n=1 Tax=Aurantimonas TaxID=182269 RepID=UPI003512D36F